MPNYMEPVMADENDIIGSASEIIKGECRLFHFQVSPVHSHTHTHRLTV